MIDTSWMYLFNFLNLCTHFIKKQGPAGQPCVLMALKRHKRPIALKGNDRIGLMKLFRAFFTKALHTDRRTDGPTDTRSFRDARMHLKSSYYRIIFLFYHFLSNFTDKDANYWRCIMKLIKPRNIKSNNEATWHNDFK